MIFLRTWSDGTTNGKIKREDFRLRKAYSFGLCLGTFLNHVHRPQSSLTWLWSEVGLSPVSLPFFISFFWYIFNLQRIKLCCWIGLLFAKCLDYVYNNENHRGGIPHSLICIVCFFDILTFWYFRQVRLIKLKMISK